MSIRLSHIIALLWFFFLVEVGLCLYVDKPLAAWAHQQDIDHHALVDFFRSITDLGKSVWYLVPSGIAVIASFFLIRGKDVKRGYRMLFTYIGLRAFFLFVSIGLSGIVADLIKPAIGRARPLLWLRDGVYDCAPFNRLGSLWESFPSGHSTTAFALACSLSLFYPRARLVWFTYAFVLALSRLMVTAHYASDVFAGAVLGWLTVVVVSRYGINLGAQVIFPADGYSDDD